MNKIDALMKAMGLLDAMRVNFRMVSHLFCPGGVISDEDRERYNDAQNDIRLARGELIAAIDDASQALIAMGPEGDALRRQATEML